MSDEINVLQATCSWVASTKQNSNTSNRDRIVYGNRLWWMCCKVMLMQEQEMRVKGCTSWGLDTAGLWLWEEQHSGAEPSLAPCPSSDNIVLVDWNNRFWSNGHSSSTDAFFATLLMSDTTREKLHAYVSAPVLSRLLSI